MKFHALRKFAAASVMLASALPLTTSPLQAGAYVAHDVAGANHVRRLALVSKNSHVRIVVDDADYACVRRPPGCSAPT